MDISIDNKPLLDWDALIALKAVAENGSLKGAADALNRVPSAISYQIRKLEHQTGVKLLEKTGKRVIFTPAGRALMKQIPDLMDAMQQTIQNVQQVAYGWEASITIVLECLIPLKDVMPTLQAFQAMKTPTYLHLRREVLAGTWDALMSGRADIAIGATAPIPEQHQLHTFELPALELVMCCAPNHPLAELAGQESIPHEEYPMVVVTDTSTKLPHRKMQVIGNSKNFTVTTLHDKLELQLSGLSYGQLPLWLAQPYLDQGKLIALEPPTKGPAFYVAWRKTDKGKALNWFLEALRDLKFS